MSPSRVRIFPTPVSCRGLVLGALGLLLAFLPAGTTSAQCDRLGNDVTCTGTDLDGFDAGVDDGLTVTVETGATVENGGIDDVAAIRLNDENEPVQIDGTITASGMRAGGVSAGDNNMIASTGSISVTGERGKGIAVGTDNEVVIAGDAMTAAEIATSGADSIGVDVDDMNTLTIGSGLTGDMGEELLTARVTAAGDGSRAIKIGDESTLTVDVDGAVLADGLAAEGISGDDDNIVAVRGSLTVDGVDARGVVLDERNTLSISGTVQATGTNATGIVANTSNPITLEAGGSLDLAGQDATAIEVVGTSNVVTSGGALVLDGDGTTGVRAVGDSNTVTIEADGSIDLTGSNATGIEVGDESEVTNGGALTIDGTGGVGILAGNDNARVQNDGDIALLGSDGTGIEAGMGNAVTNAGNVMLGADGTGISVDTGNTVTNSGSLVLGDGGTGIRAGSLNTQLRNDGRITVGAAGMGIDAVDGNDIRGSSSGFISLLGDDAVGIRAGNETTIDTRNTIDQTDPDDPMATAGSSAIGIQVGDDNNVTSRGAIILLGDGSTGILAGNDNVEIENVGDITVRSGGTGMEVGDDNISVSNSSGGIIYLLGDDGVGMRVGDGNTAIDNRGMITQQDPDDPMAPVGSSPIGILGGDANTVTNSGMIDVHGAEGIAILLGAAAGTENTLTNTGDLIGGDGSGKAVSFEPGGNATNTLTNSGSIDGSASGLAILGGAGTDLIENRSSGQIAGSMMLGDGSDTVQHQGMMTGGSVLLGDGNDTFIFGSDAATESSPAGTVTDDVTIDGGTGTGDRLRLRGTGDSRLELGKVTGFETIAIDSEGSWILDGDGSPTLTRLDGGTLALDETVTLTGNYSQSSDTTLSIRLHPDGSSDQLVVDGSVLIADGATLSLIESEPVLGSTTYTILTSLSGDITGLFDEILFETSATQSAAQRVVDGSLLLDLFRASYASLAATPNQASVGGHLDASLAAGPTGDFAAVFESLNTLSQSELQAAYDTLHPEAYDAHTSSMLALGRAFADIAARDRAPCKSFPHPLRPTAEVPGPCSKGWMPWVAAHGLFANRQGETGHISFDSAGGGFLLGVDRALGDHLVGTVYAGGGISSLEIESVGHGSVATVELGVGAVYRRNALRLSGVLTYGHGWHYQERAIRWQGLSRDPVANFQSNRIATRLEAGYQFDFGSFELVPLGTLEYAYLGEGSFRETRANSIDLVVDERSNSVFSTTLGARVAYDVFKYRFHGNEFEWADGTWRPAVGLRWRANWTDTDREIDARLAGAASSVSAFGVGAEDAKHGAEIDAGLTFQPVYSRVLLGLGYNGFIASKSTVHRVEATIRVPLGG